MVELELTNTQMLFLLLNVLCHDFLHDFDTNSKRLKDMIDNYIRLFNKEPVLFKKGGGIIKDNPKLTEILKEEETIQLLDSIIENPELEDYDSTKSLNELIENTLFPIISMQFDSPPALSTRNRLKQIITLINVYINDLLLIILGTEEIEEKGEQGKPMVGGLVSPRSRDASPVSPSLSPVKSSLQRSPVDSFESLNKQSVIPKVTYMDKNPVKENKNDIIVKNFNKKITLYRQSANKEIKDEGEKEYYLRVIDNIQKLFNFLNEKNNFKDPLEVFNSNRFKSLILFYALFGFTENNVKQIDSILEKKTGIDINISRQFGGTSPEGAKMSGVRININYSYVKGLLIKLGLFESRDIYNFIETQKYKELVDSLNVESFYDNLLALELILLFKKIKLQKPIQNLSRKFRNLSKNIKGSNMDEKLYNTFLFLLKKYEKYNDYYTTQELDLQQIYKNNNIIKTKSPVSKLRNIINNAATLPKNSKQAINVLCPIASTADAQSGCKYNSVKTTSSFVSKPMNFLIHDEDGLLNYEGVVKNYNSRENTVDYIMRIYTDKQNEFKTTIHLDDGSVLKAENVYKRIIKKMSNILDKTTERSKKIFWRDIILDKDNNLTDLLNIGTRKGVGDFFQEIYTTFAYNGGNKEDIDGNYFNNILFGFAMDQPSSVRMIFFNLLLFDLIQSGSDIKTIQETFNINNIAGFSGHSKVLIFDPGRNFHNELWEGTTKERLLVPVVAKPVEPVEPVESEDEGYGSLPASQEMVSEPEPEPEPEPESGEMVLQEDIVEEKPDPKQEQMVLQEDFVEDIDWDIGKYTGYVNEYGKPHGKGKFTYEYGDVYEGEFKDGKYDGKGKFTYEDGDVYEGEFKDGKYDGKGKYTFADGDVYEGEYKNGKRDGKGKFTYEDGDVYEGEFKDYKYNGKGKYTFADGSVYTGYVNEYGKPHDKKGKHTKADGSVYEGEFKDGKYDGKGTYTYADGDVYEGEFKNDLRHGKGTYTYADGDVYEGEWKNGKRINREPVRGPHEILKAQPQKRRNPELKPNDKRPRQQIRGVEKNREPIRGPHEISKAQPKKRRNPELKPNDKRPRQQTRGGRKLKKKKTKKLKKQKNKKTKRKKINKKGKTHKKKKNKRKTKNKI